MSNQCFNDLHLNGDPEYTSKFAEWLKSAPDVGKHLFDLEEEGAAEGWASKLPVQSSFPWVNTFDVCQGSIAWQSRSYPSIIAVMKLSSQFPESIFTFNYDQLGGTCSGLFDIANGMIVGGGVISFDRNILEILVDDHDLLSLGEGERIEDIGLGGVEVICTTVRDQDGFAIKTFNVIFNCDQSPTFFVTIDREGCVDSYTYADDGDNENVEDSGFYSEMIIDLQSKGS